ncbi:MAG: hypothetical protein L0H73_08295 [Nitrococcus sp.]|nr:hypothetical protein [Nitrococcus sp.]
MAGQHALDFAELDAETAHLDLMIQAAEAVEHAVSSPDHDIAARVHHLAGTQRVVAERFGRALGQVDVPAAHARAADPELAFLAARDWLHLLVEHVEITIIDRTPDRDRIIVIEFFTRNAVVHTHVGALGRAVRIDDLCLAPALAQPGPQARLVDQLAAEEHLRQRREGTERVLARIFEQYVERAWRAVQVCDVMLGDEREDLRGVESGRIRDHQLAAHQQRSEHTLLLQVEAD